MEKLNNEMWVAVVTVVAGLVWLLRRFIRGGASLRAVPMAQLEGGWVRGKRVVVTGGTAGIGLAECEGLVRMGAAAVVVGSLTEKEGEEAKKSLLGLGGSTRIEVLPLDLRDSGSIDRFMANAAERGPVDAVLSCAGVCSWNRLMIQVNFVGTVKLVRAARPLLSRGGRVVVVASNAHALGEIRLDDLELKRFDGVVPSLGKVWSNQVNYGTTKLYLICYLLQLMRRFPDLRIAFVQPGAVRTTMGEENAGVCLGLVKALKWLLFRTPWQGAQTALHLLSVPDLQFEPGRNWANNAVSTFVNAACGDQRLCSDFYEAANRHFFN